MTTPDIITPVSGSSPKTDVGGSWHTGVYQYHSTDGDKEIYSLSFPQSNGSYTNMGINSAIYVETSGTNANTWYDYTTTSIPQTVSDTGTQIKLYDANGALMITLPKPTIASWIASGPTADSYNRASTTAVTKTFAKARSTYKTDGIVIDNTPVTVDGGYNTFNVPSEIFCPPTRATYAEYAVDLAKFNSVKLNESRNNVFYTRYFFGGALPNVLGSTYQFVSLQATAPFESNNNWFVNYETYGFHINNDSYEEIITGGSHNPAHSVLIRYNITTNTWVSNLGIVSSTTHASGNYKILTISCVSPNSTEQWSGFSNLSYTTTDLLKFVVENETNVSSETTPVQSEVESATTTSDGGGKRRRYPIISTNLFDRQRSIFSIGLTHKDETLF